MEIGVESMKKIIRYGVESKNFVFVEVNEDARELVRAGGMFDCEQIPRDFGEILDSLNPAISSILDKIRGLENAPNEVNVAFGIKIDEDKGAIISSDHENNFEIELKWVKK